MTSTVNNTLLADELEGRRKKGDAQEIKRNIIRSAEILKNSLLKLFKTSVFLFVIIETLLVL